MPAKKKKGKASKLARMSDEERLRYLQHRAELELEAKRRKQELIAVFTKSKLKREEAFARLNTAKINEQWRYLLRQIKRKELYDKVDYLWKNFDRTLKAKDALIHKLYEELEAAGLNNRKLQESHMEMIDKLIDRHVGWLELMHGSYVLAIRGIETGEMEQLNVVSSLATKERGYLETVILAQSMRTEDTLAKTRTRNAVNACGIEHFEREDIALLRDRVGGRMESLWTLLAEVISQYESSSAEKRKQYEYLKEQDSAMRSEAAQFKRLQWNLRRSVDELKESYYKLMNERYRRIDELNDRVEESNDSVRKSRQELRIHRTMDAVQLKRLSVSSVTVVNELKTIEEKSSALLLLLKMCSSLEPTALAVKKYAIHCGETTEQTHTCVTSPYDKMDKFWEQYNYVKAGNIQKKSDLDRLVLENSRLRQSLRNYLVTMSRIPVGKPQTPI